IPGIYTEILNLAQGPAQGKPVHLRLSGDDPEAIAEAAVIARTKFEETEGLVDIEDTLPLPGIDWQIDVDVEAAGRYGADVATVGAMVQLVTRGILLDTMRVPSSDEEIEIRARLPEDDRVLATLDTLKVRTMDGLIPLSNFITRKPVQKLAQIDRVDQARYFDVKADVVPGLALIEVVIPPAEGAPERAQAERIAIGLGQQMDAAAMSEGAQANLRLLLPSSGPFGFFGGGEAFYQVERPSGDIALSSVQALIDDGATISTSVLNPNERIGVLTEWLNSDDTPLPVGVDWEWTGDQEEQEESGQFLMTAFAGALGLMFIILLAQFNSFYNAALVLLAVILSTTGVLIGMLVMNQAFSIIMTGTGIVALAGIVVNNNIVLIDTYQEYSQYMPRIEAIVRTAEARIRPVLLTTITTMAGLAPMMFGLSLDFFAGGYSIDSPTALWWKQLATAVVFGLGIATMLTLVFTPSMLAIRVWLSTGVYRSFSTLKALSYGSGSKDARDRALQKQARRVKNPEIIWDVDSDPTAPRLTPGLRAAE
ncbi:MAG: efflux RND transporter permease subunit, partial [Pseudomonadota bacterium]